MLSVHLQKGSNLASVQLRRKKAEVALRTITRVFLEQLLHLGPQTFKLQNRLSFFLPLPLKLTKTLITAQYFRKIHQSIPLVLKIVQGQILHLSF